MRIGSVSDFSGLSLGRSAGLSRAAFSHLPALEIYRSAALLTSPSCRALFLFTVLLPTLSLAAPQAEHGQTQQRTAEKGLAQLSDSAPASPWRAPHISVNSDTPPSERNLDAYLDALTAESVEAQERGEEEIIRAENQNF